MSAMAEEAPVASNAWAVRRMRAVMLKTLPDMPNALCRSPKVDPDLWHPPRTNRRQEVAAVSVCLRCPEMLACLAYAIRAHPISGVWGGTTELQRRVLVSNTAIRVAFSAEPED